MPNDDLSDAIKEAYASCPNDVVILDTLEVQHPLIEDSIFIVNNNEEITATLETDEEVIFRAVGFSLSLPASGNDGLQELAIKIDDVESEVSDFINTVKESNEPVKLIYRPYLSTDLTQHGLGNNPLRLNLTDVRADDFSVSGKGTFADLLNKSFLAPQYIRRRFPSLGSAA